MKWFVSDTHYNHSNYCKSTSKWIDKSQCRDFESVEKMNEKIVENINKYVDEMDELYFLGDWSFGGIESIWEFRKQINCKVIYFVPGNHDHHVKENKELPNCSEFNREFTDKIDTSFFIAPMYICYAQDLFIILPELTKIYIDKKEIILSHYPLEQWENMDRGAIHLHGHTHHVIDNSILNTRFRRMDVGMDWEEFRPISWDEIKEIMSKREKYIRNNE